MWKTLRLRKCTTQLLWSHTDKETGVIIYTFWWMEKQLKSYTHWVVHSLSVGHEQENRNDMGWWESHLLIVLFFFFSFVGIFSLPDIPALSSRGEEAIFNKIQQTGIARALSEPLGNSSDVSHSVILFCYLLIVWTSDMFTENPIKPFRYIHDVLYPFTPSLHKANVYEMVFHNRIFPSPLGLFLSKPKSSDCIFILLYFCECN